MSYRFRKKLPLLISLSVCLVFCESASENLTKIRDIENKSENIVLESHRFDGMPDNNSLNTTFYKVVTNEISKSHDPPIMDKNSFQKLNFFNSLKTVQEVIGKLSNSECVRDVTYVLQASSNGERWAYEMLDSFPKFPEGILYGNFYQLGNFDECIRVRKKMDNDRRSTNESDVVIKGQYCLVDIHFRRKSDEYKPQIHKHGNMALHTNRASFNNSVVHWAVCLPSSCSQNDTEIFTQEVFASSLQNFDLVSVHADSKKCEYEKSLPITVEEIVYGIIVGIFLVFTILATIMHGWYLKQLRKTTAYNVDVFRQQQPSKLKQIFSCFSLINTTERFFHTKPNELNLESICGIKFLSMVAIVAGHSLIFFFGGPIANTNFFVEVAIRPENSMFLNGPIIVDTFLLISGFLMCRLLLIEMDKRRGKINFLALYIARYIRLTPAYAVILGLYTTVLYRLGSGPFWDSKIGTERDRCKNSWYLNLLYVNNYIGTDNLCMFQSWYLAVEYHLFIVAPFVVYLLWRKPKFGVALLFLCTIVSVLVPFTITYVDSLDPTMMAFPPEVEDLARNYYYVHYYIKTHMRCSSYCIGLFYAYLVHKLQRDSIKIPGYVIICGWILSIVSAVGSMASVVIFFQPDHSPNILENAVYSALHRVCWALAIGWIMLVCITGNATYVNKFLSHKFFIPASRLTYCAYLTNGVVEIYSSGVNRQAMYMSKFELASKVWGHIVMTFLLAFVMCIIFESPIHGMEKILLKKVDTKPPKPKLPERFASGHT